MSEYNSTWRSNKAVIQVKWSNIKFRYSEKKMTDRQTSKGLDYDNNPNQQVNSLYISRDVRKSIWATITDAKSHDKKRVSGKSKF